MVCAHNKIILIIAQQIQLQYCTHFSDIADVWHNQTCALHFFMVMAPCLYAYNFLAIYVWKPPCKYPGYTPGISS